MRRQVKVFDEKGVDEPLPVYLTLIETEEGVLLKVVDEDGNDFSCGRLILFKANSEGIHAERYPDVNTNIGISTEGTGRYITMLRYRQTSP